MPFRMNSYPYAEAEMAFATPAESLDPFFTSSCQSSALLYPTPIFPHEHQLQAAYNNTATTSAGDYGMIPQPTHHHLPPQQPQQQQQQQQPQHHYIPQQQQQQHQQQQDFPTPLPTPYDHSVWVTPVMSNELTPASSVMGAPNGSPMLGHHTPRSSKDFSLSPNLGIQSRSSRASSFTSGVGVANGFPLRSDSSERGLSIISTGSSATSGSVTSSMTTTGGMPAAPQRYNSLSRSTSPNAADLRAYGHLNKNGTWTCSFPGCTSKAVFTRGCDLRKHHKRHTKSFFCRHQGCPQATGGGFSSKKDLARHEAKHDPHVLCEWQGCERVFSRVDNMVSFLLPFRLLVQSLTRLLLQRDHVKRIHLKASKTHSPGRASR